VAERGPGRCVLRTSGGDAFSYIGETAPARGFLGLTFTVAQREDLDEAAMRYGATPIRAFDQSGAG
jgi:ABC-type maltose transport system permease subunit